MPVWLSITLANIAFFALGARYLIRKRKEDHDQVRQSDDPRLRRSQVLADVGMVTVTCGFLLMLGWIVTQDSSATLHHLFLVLGIASIAAAFVLEGVSGWIKGGVIIDSSRRRRETR